jgi:hypothetical protein
MLFAEAAEKSVWQVDFELVKTEWLAWDQSRLKEGTLLLSLREQVKRFLIEKLVQTFHFFVGLCNERSRWIVLLNILKLRRLWVG